MIFTGSPDRLPFPTYFRHEEACNEIEIINLIKDPWPKETHVYSLAEKILTKQHSKHSADEKRPE